MRWVEVLHQQERSCSTQLFLILSLRASARMSKDARCRCSASLPHIRLVDDTLVGSSSTEHALSVPRASAVVWRFSDVKGEPSEGALKSIKDVALERRESCEPRSTWPVRVRPANQYALTAQRD
jgi:hypothetical protein